MGYEGIIIERMPLCTLEPLQFMRTSSADAFYARVIFKIPYRRSQQTNSEKGLRVSTFAVWPI